MTKPTVQPGRDNSPPIAPAFDAITEANVLDALRDATIRQLAQALDPGAFRGDNRPDSFRCPACHAPSAATVLGRWRWACVWCPGDTSSTTGGQRTRLALRRHVAEDFEASLRLVKAVAGPGLRTVKGRG